MDSNDDPEDGTVVAGTAFAAVGVYGVGALFYSPSVVWRGIVSLAGAGRRVYEEVWRAGGWVEMYGEDGGG